jgi:mercuric ion transport protein
MIRKGSSGGLTGAGILSAIAASLCCVTPVIALFAGSSSIAANLGWLEPARSYLIGISTAVLSFAWYLKLKPSEEDMNCNCKTESNIRFMQSKALLAIITCFAVLMMTFPLYAKIFYPKPKVKPLSAVKSTVRQDIKFTIQGMTCSACEEHVNNELAKVRGVLMYQTSYDSGSSSVSFDASKVRIRDIERAINKTGYQVIGHVKMKASNSQVSF